MRAEFLLTGQRLSEGTLRLELADGSILNGLRMADATLAGDGDQSIVGISILHPDSGRSVRRGDGNRVASLTLRWPRASDPAFALPDTQRFTGSITITTVDDFESVH